VNRPVTDPAQDAQECTRRRELREAEQATEPADKWWCRCDHAHPPGVVWCDLCEFPVPQPDELRAAAEEWAK
jgi:hypothetical protein